jgi:hypothetical protein
MKRTLSGLALAAASLLAHASSDDTLVQFNRGIGVDPVAGIANGAPVLNTVLGVPPGGRPWVIRRLSASVSSNGFISVRGSGLLLAGSDGIGTRATITQVIATLFCSGAPFTSAPGDLDAAGNFRIRSALTAMPPNPCNAPVLLIRNAAGNNAWFAAGIVGGDDD